MLKYRWLSLVLTFVLLVGVLAGCGGSGASSAAPVASSAPGSSAAPVETAPGWEPTKNIELVVPNGAGGGSDVFARTLVKIISDKNMCPRPIVVVNKPGGSTSIGYTYVAEAKGDEHMLATVSSSFYTTPLQGNSSVSYKDFNFIAHLCRDPLVLVVNSKSEYQTIEELMAAITNSSANMSGGGSGNMSDDAIACYMLRDLVGDLNYVPFSGGGEVLTAILGNHVNFAFVSPTECLEQVNAGNLRVLATTSDIRIDLFPDIPTFQELGMDLDLQQSRGFVMPKDTSPEAVAYYDNLFKQAFETAEFQEYLKSESIVPQYLNSADYTAFAEETNQMYTEYIGKIEQTS